MKNKNELNLTAALQSLFNNKTKDVFAKKYSTGGKLLSVLSSLIPGVGSVVSPVIGMLDQQNDASLVSKPSPIANINNNPYGNQFFDGGPIIPDTTRVNPKPTVPIINPEMLNLKNFNPLSQSDIDLANIAFDKADIANRTVMKAGELNSNKIKSKDRPFRERAMGGLTTPNFKQYDTGSHDSGNDQMINKQGIPVNNGVATIQNKENSYTQKGQTYIYSDTLVNPETGNLINIDAAKLNKKFNKAGKLSEEKNALDFTMNRLSKINDGMRNVKETVDKTWGGKTEEDGNPTDPNVIPASSNLQFYADLPGLYSPTLPTLPLPDSVQRNTVIERMPSTITPPKVTAPSLKAKTSNNNLSSPNDVNYNIPAGVLKGIALGKSVIDALTPAEKENTILPDYRKSDAEMYATNIDYTQAKQDAIGASNLASNMNRSASRGVGQFQVRQMNNFANLSDQLGRIDMQENLQRNQLHTQRAGYEQGKAIDTANRNTQNRINNQQNQANADYADEKLFSEIADVGTQFNKYEYYKDMVKNKKEIAQATINEGLTLIGSKYSNFGFTSDFMDKIKTGKASIDELVTFMSTVDKVKSKTTN